jgi:hypothetical protein
MCYVVCFYQSEANPVYTYSDQGYRSMKQLDNLSTNVLKNALKFTGTVKKMIAPDAQMDSEVPRPNPPEVIKRTLWHICHRVMSMPVFVPVLSLESLSVERRSTMRTATR